MKVLFPPHPCQHLLLVVELFVLAIIRGVMWNISVVLICISFVFFGHLDFFFAKVLFSSVAHFFIGSLIFGEFSFF
jgi:hypothetical protein